MIGALRKLLVTVLDGILYSSPFGTLTIRLYLRDLIREI